MNEIIKTVVRFIKKRVSKLTASALALLILFGIPNLFGYASIGRLAIVSVGLLLIWLDQVRITKKLHGKKPYDEETLKGRTLKLRDDIQAFLETIGSIPETERTSGMSELAYSEVKITNVINWAERLRHGFALRFEDRLKRICHECGESGTGNSMFEVRISKEQTSKEDIEKIIEDLDWFAKNVD